MKLFATFCALVAFAGLAVAEEKKAAPKFDAEKLVGKWKFTEGMKSGEKVEAKNLEGSDVTITKDSITIEGGGEKHVMKFKIDASKSPVQIDMDGEEGPAKGTKAEGIIAIDGDTIKLAYATNFPGLEGKRPEKFESTKDNKSFYFVMKLAN
jgi:uncharacterized protein (TIGR03067 family)